MIHLAEPDDIFYKVPLLDLEPEIREELTFHFSDKPVSRGILKQSIDTFYSEHEWEGMWNVNQGLDRFNHGHVFSYMADERGVLGYMWHYKNYTYNFFISKRRKNRDVLDFVNMNRYLQYQRGYENEVIYITGNNTHVHNLFKKRFNGVQITKEQAEDEIN